MHHAYVCISAAPINMSLFFLCEVYITCPIQIDIFCFHTTPFCSISSSPRICSKIMKKWNSSWFCNVWFSYLSWLYLFVFVLHPPSPLYVHVYLFVCVHVSLDPTPQRFLAGFIVFCCAAAHHEELPSLCDSVRCEAILCTTKHASVCVSVCLYSTPSSLASVESKSSFHPKHSHLSLLRCWM